MDDSIGVGIIVGLTFVSSIYVWNNDKFNRVQKTVLLICIIFPPVQWLGILLVSIYNSSIENNTPERKTEKKLDSTISNLTELKEKGILTQEEYVLKVEKIEIEKAEQELKNSIEYKQLKSLLDSNILTIEEFDNKIRTLIEKKTLTNIEIKNSSDSEFILNPDLDEEKNIPKVIEKKDKFFPYFIGGVILMIIASLINWNEVIGSIESFQDRNNEEIFAEPIVDTIAVSENNYNTINEPIKNYLKKYVYIIVTVEEPRLVHNTGIYLPSGNSLIPDTYTGDIDYVVYDKSTFSTEIEEIEDYNEDVKYKLLDKAEYDVKRRIGLGSTFQMDLLTKCKDENKRNSLKENYPKIAERQIYTFDNYAEASLDKHKDTHN